MTLPEIDFKMNSETIKAERKLVVKWTVDVDVDFVVDTEHEEELVNSMTAFINEQYLWDSLLLDAGIFVLDE